jgi:hypothetical protein
MLGEGREENISVAATRLRPHRSRKSSRGRAKKWVPGPLKIDVGNQCVRVSKGTALGNSRKVWTRIEDI